MITCVETPQAECRLGVAGGDVTPPVGIYHRMWGAATHERATGVHRPLTATVAVFQARDADPGSETEQVLVALDHCLFIAREMQNFMGVVARRTGVSEDRIVVAFSHTHGAGLMDLERRGLPGGELIEPYLAKLAETIAALVTQARQSAAPVTLVFGQGRCSLAAQRDFRDEETQQWVCGYNPGAPSDDSLLVARATDAEGRLVATFVNYACHPTSLAWENTLISPDYPGAMREVIEAAFSAPCLFLQGASGDLGPVHGYVGDVAVADRNGRQLGYAALSVLEALPPAGTRFEYQGPVVSGATLGDWKHVSVDAAAHARHKLWRVLRFTVPLAYRAGLGNADELRAERARLVPERSAAESAGDLIRARDVHALIERVDRQLRRLASLPVGKEFPMPVTLWQTGDVVWVAVEGEHYQWLQQTLRQSFPGTPIYVITLANGSRPSYLPTADTYDTGLYQESIALLAKGSLERLAEAIIGKLQGWLAT